MNPGEKYRKHLIDVSEAISEGERILIATHRNPDGDAVGSMLGIMHLIKNLGKIAFPFCPDGIPKKLWFLPGADSSRSTIDGIQFDATILVDTPDTGLFPTGFPDESHRGALIIIDHHTHFEPMGDVVVRTKASSVGEIIYDLARTAGWHIGPETAECLYTAIVSDTASFKYESATPSSHRAAADLIEIGVNPWKVASHLYESFSLSRQRLLAHVLGTLSVGISGRFASLYCTSRMMAEAEASNGDLDGIVNNARSLEGVDLAAFLRETPEGWIRVSLRSKGSVDASQVAVRLGGGGHVNAGGAYLKNIDMKTALRRVEEEATRILTQPA